MKRLVTLRSFEERDLDFVYRCKNDISLSELSINGYRPISYEDTAGWIDKCIHDDGTYKYWAICTDDEFQNIVGWCAISRINYLTKQAFVHGIMIADSKYRDGSALFTAGIYMVDYVFEKLGFDKIETECLSGQLNTKVFLDLILQKNDHVENKAVCREGVYYDIVYYSIQKEDYELKKKEGLFDYDSCVAKIKNQIRKNNTTEETSLTVFLERFKSILDESDHSQITAQTRFVELREWSSLFAIEMAAIVEEVCKVRLEPNDLQECETIEELYNYALQKK